MTERIIPQIMQMPAAPTQEEAAAASAAETARVQNDRLNQCPICHKTLIHAEANGIPVTLCSDHTIVMPLKDAQ